jgi:hypothetical protein
MNCVPRLETELTDELESESTDRGCTELPAQNRINNRPLAARELA